MQLNTNNIVAVTYANGQVRIRNCQSSYYPSRMEMRPVRNINDWYEYVRFTSDAVYGADASLDATIAADTIIQTANYIINRKQSL